MAEQELKGELHEVQLNQDKIIKMDRQMHALVQDFSSRLQGFHLDRSVELPKQLKKLLIEYESRISKHSGERAEEKLAPPEWISEIYRLGCIIKEKQSIIDKYQRLITAHEQEFRVPMERLHALGKVFKRQEDSINLLEKIVECLPSGDLRIKQAANLQSLLERTKQMKNEVADIRKQLLNFKEEMINDLQENYSQFHSLVEGEEIAEAFNAAVQNKQSETTNSANQQDAKKCEKDGAQLPVEQKKPAGQSQKNSNIDCLQNQLEEALQKIQSLQQLSLSNQINYDIQIGELKSQLNQYKSKSNILAEELQKTQQDYNIKITSIINDCNSKVEESTSNIVELENKIRSGFVNSDRNIKQNATLSMQIEDLKKVLAQKQMSYTNSLKSKDEEIANLSKQLQELKTERNELLVRIQILNSCQQDIKSQTSNNTEEMGQAQQTIGIKQLSLKIQSITKQRDLLRLQVDKLKNKLNSAISNFDKTMKNANDSVSKLKDQYISKIQELEKMYKDNSGQVIKDLNTKIFNLEKQLDLSHKSHQMSLQNITTIHQKAVQQLHENYRKTLQEEQQNHQKVMLQLQQNYRKILLQEQSSHKKSLEQQEQKHSKGIKQLQKIIEDQQRNSSRIFQIKCKFFKEEIDKDLKKKQQDYQRKVSGYRKRINLFADLFDRFMAKKMPQAEQRRKHQWEKMRERMSQESFDQIDEREVSSLIERDLLHPGYWYEKDTLINCNRLKNKSELAIHKFRSAKS